MMKLFLSFLIIVCFSWQTSSQTTLDEIIGDMTLPHEGFPHGVPSSYDWYSKPRKGAPEPGLGWTAAIAWGQVYEWAGGNPATNTRIQIKDLAMYYLSKKDNKWHLLQSSGLVSGANYVEDFAGDVNKPANIRVEKDGSISTTCGGGYNFHFWPNTGRITIPVNDVAGCFVTVKARLVIDDAAKSDDREKAKYLMSVGGDWWQSLTAPWDNFKTNADIGIGRFRFITSEWKSFNMYSVPADSIRKNPPPFVAITTGISSLNKAESIGFNGISNNSGNILITIFNHRNETVSLSVYDLNGRKIDTLSNHVLTAGNHSFKWNSKSQKPGIYILKLASANQFITAKIQVFN
jgi:hypothetical protein